MLRSALRQTTCEVLNWLLPSECLLCQAATDANPDQVPLTVCVDCFEALLPPVTTVCVACGAQLGPHASPSGRCPHCRGRRFRFKSVTCLGMYNGLLRRLLLQGKWSLSSNSIRTLASVYVEARAVQLRSLNIERIIPIPQIWHLRARRNFNAAVLLAAEIGKLLKRPVDLQVLQRSRGTRPQKRASFSDRGAIQRNSYRIRDAHVIRGERILLVDDVLTTGATCDEAAGMLGQAGAKLCHVAVLARVSATSS